MGRAVSGRTLPRRDLPVEMSFNRWVVLNILYLSVGAGLLGTAAYAVVFALVHGPEWLAVVGVVPAIYALFRLAETWFDHRTVRVGTDGVETVGSTRALRSFVPFESVATVERRKGTVILRLRDGRKARFHRAADPGLLCESISDAFAAFGDREPDVVPEGLRERVSGLQRPGARPESGPYRGCGLTVDTLLRYARNPRNHPRIRLAAVLEASERVTDEQYAALRGSAERSGSTAFERAMREALRGDARRAERAMRGTVGRQGWLPSLQ